MLLGSAFLVLGLLCLGFGIDVGRRLRKTATAPWLVYFHPNVAVVAGVFFILSSIYIFLLALGLIS